jgi:hypothetical protein
LNCRASEFISGSLKVGIHVARGKSPNDPKLSDSGVRRGTCMVGGKAAQRGTAEAGIA